MSVDPTQYALLAQLPVQSEREIAVPQARLELPEIKGIALNTRIQWRIVGETLATVERATHDTPPREMALGLSHGMPGEILGQDAYGTFQGQSDEGTAVSFDHMHSLGYSHNLMSMDLTNIRLGFSHIKLTHQPNAEPVSRRYVFTNVHMPIWPQMSARPGGGWARDTLALVLDGRIIHLSRSEAVPGVATVVMDEAIGSAYENRLLRALLLLLTFLVGARVDVVAMERYDAKGDLIDEELYDPDIREMPARFPPINWTESHYGSMYLARMPVVVSELLKQYLELDRALLLSEVVGYIMTSKDTFPEISFALLSIALDSMANAYEKRYQPDWDKKMMEKAAFKAIAEELKAKLDELLAHPDQAGLLNRFKSKVANMNQTGNANMFILFVKSLGLEVAQTELDLFQLRNDVVHEGVLQVNRDSIDFQSMLDSLGKLVTVVNFCFLRLLGYSGLIVDYGVIGHPSKWIGDPPPGPTPEQLQIMGLTQPEPPESADES